MFGSAKSDIPKKVGGVPAKSRGDKAWQILREAIFTGRFAPGAPLRFQEMQTLCGMSVSPVREALTRLVAEGLVETEHNRGYRVTPLSRGDLEDLVRTRIRLEGWALERAIELGDERWEARIMSSLHVLSRLPRRRSADPRLMDEEWERRHNDFHTSLIAACDSPTTLQICRALSDRADRYRQISLAFETGPRDVDAEHAAIAEAALARDPAKARNALATHYEQTTRYLSTYLAAD
ncbi:MAG: FCD domain-containing protein [Pseudolabrys sp.]|nr:FCD domain-containing protein [Pseudolabrys sp.]